MKTIFCLIFLPFLFETTDAQILSGYGFKLGIGISNQTWDNEYDINMNFDSKSGFTARFFVDILDIPFFQVEGEAGYIRKGVEDQIPITTEEQPDGTGEFVSVNNNLDYLTFAVLAKFKLGIPLISPYILAGPQWNVLLNKDVSAGWEIVYDDFNSSNFGYSLGVGAEILDLLPVSLLIEYRFEQDFKDIYEPSFYEIKNYSHVIMAGIRF